MARRRLDDLFREARLAIEPVTVAQARIAREAYRDFGKGSRHPAKLNFGDCFAYALAKSSGEPLLFKGQDFAHTEVGELLNNVAPLPDPTTATRALRRLACPSPPTTSACRPNSSDISVEGISRSGVLVTEAPNQRMFVRGLALRATGNQMRPAAWVRETMTVP